MSLLNRRYPFLDSQHWLKDCGLYCFIVFLILYLLQPFGFSAYQGNKLLASMLFGIITFGCCTLFYFFAFIPLTTRVGVWKIWHQALTTLAMIFLIGICNFLVFSFIFHYSLSFYVLGLFLYWTLLIGIIITICSISISYHRYLRSKLESLLDKTTAQQEGVSITIKDNSIRGNDLQLAINNLLYIEAQKNNVVVCHRKDGHTERTELHTTLTAVLNDLQAYGNIFQCHRSFVVNLNNITSAQGNSNGYQLKLGGCTTVVPVSRTYVPKLRSFIA